MILLKVRLYRIVMNKSDQKMAKQTLKILIANPRGFCAGVQRAIQIVEVALKKYGVPVYVRHEIVHNKFVVDTLKNKGAIFVDELNQVPEEAPVIFSAHGVPKSVPLEAERRKLLYVDATCPLVSKVHREAEQHNKNNNHVIMIGHEGHPEVIGTLGQVPEGKITLVESIEDVKDLNVPTNKGLAFLTQTTLSIDDTKDIIKALQAKYPDISSPKKEDICYATTNRQEAAKEITKRSDKLIVIGATNSSNSLRLVEVATRQNIPAKLLQRATDIEWEWLQGTKTLGITAGASAPEVLVEEVLDALKNKFNVNVEIITTREEDVTFKLPPILLKEVV